MINENKKWNLGGEYIDEGISGTSVKNRDNFLRMIEDSKQGKLDLIVTKEISRFSRNVIDSIKYTEELLNNGTVVFFISDNINTIYPDSEFRLALMSSLVQDEVRKLSERVKFGIKRMIKDGKIIGGNLTNYNGNKSTSLIGCDLLTPDEVKNLHYKTIIFPNIGYSIFRDTVIYKKLSCYSAGELKRKITSLEDLSYIYFTAENIETKYDKLYRNRNNKEINKEELSFYDKFKTEEINKLNNIVNIVNDLLKDKIKIFEFKENNNRTFASFELKEPLSTKESIFLKGKINKEVYHFEIDNGDNTKSTIEIHLKNPLEKDNSLQKEIIKTGGANE